MCALYTIVLIWFVILNLYVKVTFLKSTFKNVHFTNLLKISLNEILAIQIYNI